MIRNLKTLAVLFFGLLFAPNSLCSQELAEKLTWEGDFRFRVEHDWNSRRSDGTYRDDRTRLRYRARLGVTYKHNDWASFGLRLRTGYREKQQDPQLTIGDGFNEFPSVPIGFEKMYFRAQHKWLDAWVGKNTFPFEKQNELFWSDNVFPDGVYFSSTFELEPNWIDQVRLGLGHFILVASNSTFDKDSYIQVAQVTTHHLDRRLAVFPTFYFFKDMPDIPDGNENYRFNYSILHLGTHFLAFEKPDIILGLDLYQNIENYQKVDSIPENLRDQKKGFVASVVWGQLKKAKDLKLGVYYMYLERYSAVDFIAQNDWARWDYSNQGSPDGRLTNYKGFEFIAAYRLNKSMKLSMRYFKVEQLKASGPALENGDRIRFDIDIWF